MGLFDFIPNLNLGIIHPKATTVTDPTKKTAVQTAYNLGVGSGQYPSVGPGTGQSVAIKAITDNAEGSKVSIQNFKVSGNIANPKVTQISPSVAQQVTQSATNLSKKGVSVQMLSDNTTYLPGSDNTIYLPFGGNNNQQPGSNPYLVLPGGVGTQNDNSSGNGLDIWTIALIGGLGLAGAYIITRH